MSYTCAKCGTSLTYRRGQLVCPRCQPDQPSPARRAEIESLKQQEDALRAKRQELEREERRAVFASQLPRSISFAEAEK